MCKRGEITCNFQHEIFITLPFRFMNNFLFHFFGKNFFYVVKYSLTAYFLGFVVKYTADKRNFYWIT